MKRRRSLGLFACAFLIISLVDQISAQIRATEKPFLWRIDGAVPSYLYGTVHVPDPRVLELPEVVRRALNASDVFNGEILLDANTQASMLGKVMLPAGQNLRSVVGEDVFARLVRVVSKLLGDRVPPGAADILGVMLSPM